jgi:hypothetical protein
MLGCDLHAYCQNWVTSQALRDPAAVAGPMRVAPAEIVLDEAQTGKEWKRFSKKPTSSIACSTRFLQDAAPPFCHGQPKAVRVGSLPMSLTAETTSASNFASRSNSKNLCGGW